MDWKGIQRLVVLGLVKEADSNKYFCLCGKSIQSPTKGVLISGAMLTLTTVDSDHPRWNHV